MKNVSDTITSEEAPNHHSDNHVNQHYSDMLKLEDCIDLIPGQNKEPDYFSNMLPLDVDQDILNDQQQSQIVDDPFSQEVIHDKTDAFNNVTFRNPSHETIALEQEDAIASHRCRSRASTSSSAHRGTSERMLHERNPSGQRPRSAIPLHSTISPIADVKRPRSSLGIPANYNRPTSAHSSTSSITRIMMQDRSAEKLPYNETPDIFKPFCWKKTPHTHRFPNSTCKSCQDKEVKQLADMLAG